MSLYELNTGTKAELIDENGVALTHSQITGSIADESIVTFTEVDGVVFLLAGSVGTTAVTITPSNSIGVEHDVTVVAAPFDWSLGTPA